MNRKLSFEKRLHNALAVQEVEHVKALHSYTHAFGRGDIEWATVWNRSDDATWAHSFGRMVGFSQIWYNSVIAVDVASIRESISMVRDFPEIWGMDLRCVGGIGLHTLGSSVIEVSDDGKSARSFYLTPGTNGCVLPLYTGGRSLAFLWERYGSDFIFEDGRWVYFHEQVCPDVGGDYGTSNWANRRFCETLEGRPEPPRQAFPPCEDDWALHNDYTPAQPVQNTVPWPLPYVTLDDENSYSPGRNDPNKGRLDARL